MTSEEIQIVNSSAKSKSRPKASLNPRDTKRLRSQLMTLVAPPASSRGLPMPPPPPSRIGDSIGNTSARTPPSQDVPVPPSPAIGKVSGARHATHATSRWTPSLGAHWSWRTDGHNAKYSQSAGWRKG